MRLVAPTPHEIVLRPWRSSAAVESWYGSTLEKMVRAMVLSVSYWVKATYGKNVGLIAMDEADGHEFHGNQYTGGISGEEASSIREYCGRGYGALNGALRKNEKLDKKQTLLSSHLDSAIAKSELAGGLLYRSIDGKSVQKIFGFELKKGMKIKDQGFISTTPFERIARGLVNTKGVILEIATKQGQKGLSVKEFSGSSRENEFILPRGSEFKVTGVVAAQGTQRMRIKLEYLGKVGIAQDEAEGHEFHGNQYVEGESGEKEHGKGGVKHEVEKLIKEGKLSYAEIAKVVATKFGGKTSKESVAWYASKLKQAGKEKPAASKEEREKPKSISDWHQVGKQMGSNPGGVFEDEHGVSYYTKFSKDEDHARNEVLASKLYQAAGVNVIESQLVQKDGQFGVAGEMKPGLSKGTPAQLAAAKGVAEGFVADAWLANRDVVGLGYDNLLLNKAGEAVRVDPGGALLYRAQGADKPGFGNEAKELDSLRNSSINEQAYKVFGKLTDKQLEASASRVTSISDARIREIIEAHGPGNTAARAALADKMIARKASIAKQFPGAAQAHDSMMTDSPSSDMDNVMAKLAKQWGATFNSMAHTIAHAFTQQCLTHHDLAMKTSLDHAGFSVPFQMTPHMADRVEGLTAENVSLIKSIPAEYLGKVHAKVLESVRKGRDLKELTSELQGLVEIGKPDWSHNQVVRRARFIARQENNKATAAFQQIRLLDLGVDESYWQHTMSSKEPRPEHEGWSDDGLRYKVSKGMYSDEAGKWVLPGEDYNCGCTGAPIVPGYNDKGKNTENDEEEAA